MPSLGQATHDLRCGHKAAHTGTQPDQELEESFPESETVSCNLPSLHPNLSFVTWTLKAARSYLKYIPGVPCDPFSWSIGRACSFTLYW